MQDSRGQDYERTLALGEKAMAHIRSHRTAAYPRAYELWYTYAAGHQPALMRAINDLLRRYGRVTQAELDDIYDRFINSNRFTAEAERATVRLLSQMETVGHALDEASGEINTYRGALNSSVDEMDGGITEQRLREMVGELTARTRHMSRLNGRLKEQLNDAQSEVAELREALESIRTESQIDPVTTLANRLHFDQAFPDHVKYAQRSGEPMTLLMCDIDHFKRFNDTYGHVTGDQVLRLVAQSIKNNIKGVDLAARYGGEEFAVVLPNCTLDGGVAVAERLRTAVMARELVKRSTGENLGRVTISIGVAEIRRSETPIALLERADAALYAAKRAGRNRVEAASGGLSNTDSRRSVA